LLLAEPHEGLRGALARFLEADYEVVATVADVTDLARAARATSPDVILLDETLLPAATRWARDRRRGRSLVGGIVVLGRHEATALWSKRFSDDRAGWVPKWAAATELGPAIQAALG
jgi:DNA-binding NarL/FixJ family response regulator